ncbi:MAG: hypothetical protein LBL48_06330 [Azoarcus sp.]|nr:hypothetical protein [Azoarcus sp.]
MIEEIEAINDILEEFAVLTQHQETWFDDALEKGLLQGREEGRTEGRIEGRIEGRTEGRTEGRNEALLTVARNLLGLGRSTEEIVQITGLSPKDIQALLH